MITLLIKVAAGILCLFSSLVVGSVTGWTDEIRLTNDDRLSGQVMSLSRESVRLLTPHSGTLEIGLSHLRHLTTDAPMIVHLVSGEQVIGRIAVDQQHSITIYSATLGPQTLPLGAVSTVAQRPADAPGSVLSSDSRQQLAPSAQILQLRGKGSEDGPPAGPSQAKMADNGARPPSIGPKPPDEEDIRRLFLRQSSVLLNPGQIELEAGLTYFSKQTSQTVYNARFRQFEIPLSLRMGLMERLEGSLTLPLAHAEQEFSFSGDSVTERTCGIGDASLGLNYDLFSETALWPDIIATFHLRAPTGQTPDENGLSLGTGHWAGGLGLQFIKTVDPMVLFWGVRYTHAFPATHFYNDGVYEVRPGPSVDYNFGFGFAVNDTISLSAQAEGGYQSDTEADGRTISGSAREPFTLRSALTYRVSRRLLVEPYLAIGLNDDTADFSVGLAASRRLGD